MRTFGLALFLCLALSACGYNSGLRVTEHHDSVGIELFGNETLERDLEPELHDEMTHVLREQSDARLVDPRVAQAVIRGVITAYHRRGGIRSTDNQLQETGIYVEVQAKLFVGGNETPVRSSTASVWVGFVLGKEQSENERAARGRALRHVAEELVLELLGPSDDA